MENILILAKEVGLVAVDVGARGGFKSDLSLIQKNVDYVGFDPDSIECEKLNALPCLDWKSGKYIPVALSDKDEDIHINLYRQRGCSSFYDVDLNKAKLFSRDDYYQLDEVVSVPAKTFDDCVNKYDITEPAYMKIDVQGMENKVFEGATNSLSEDLVGIRIEVSFFPIYDGQTMLADVDKTLRNFGFYPMRFIELHEWRRTTKIKYPLKSENDIPYSRGQIVHGDLLYLKSPESISLENDNSKNLLIRLALISICYGHFDHAIASLDLAHKEGYLSLSTYHNTIKEIKILSRKERTRALIKEICKKICFKLSRNIAVVS